MFHIATEEAIRNGRTTDVYFERARRILEARGLNPRVKAEFAAKELPRGWPWAVFAGLEEAATLLQGLPVRVRAFAEGEIVYPGDPVLEIEGNYRDFMLFETAVLGFLCQASGVATMAARYRKRAGDRQVISFGARRMHPAVSPMIERNAFIGGCDGVASVAAAELLGRDPLGTMPHSLVLILGSTLEAAKAFDEVIEPAAARVALIDTFRDEKFECLDLSRELGGRLRAVRFDTPASRRGDLLKILQECRWELNLRGFEAVKFFISGGIREEDIERLNPLTSGYGIGAGISSAPVVDYSMDLVEIDGRPIAKRGKASGAKRCLECAACGDRRVIPAAKEAGVCACGGRYEDLLVPLLDHGRRLEELPPPETIRNGVLKRLDSLPV